ncbi:xanthine dehydrogenase family protein molybdopterin-binding subunit [Kiloniella sp. EL199]|uniref:xanthine dehydrogenase family protein molybdopterin-binding subunit n=1 Tax=Kiloniella sp. EL199 TaxID=2107581 RepID=UPI000EA3BAD9|nr:molybdopterin cofactor-binding domain-containing protein [Kiloniella sp. EL199]
MVNSIKDISLSRRQLLKATGWSAVGMTLLSSCSSILPALPSTSDPVSEDAFYWFQLLPSGKVKFFCPRIEMGQGTTTGLSQVVAEELNVDFADIECLTASTEQVPPFKMTVGSEGIAKFWQPVAYGAAHMREALRGRAASLAGIEVDKISDAYNGFKIEDDRIILYHDLVSDEPILLNVPDPIEVKNVKLYSLQSSRSKLHIGHDRVSTTMKNIVTGTEIYARDFKIPDTVFGHFFRPPALGVKIESAHLNNVQDINGVIRVKKQIEENLVAVVATDPISLRLAVEEIDVIWRSSSINTTELLSKINVAKIKNNKDLEHILVEKGDSETLPPNAKIIKSNYSTPCMAHASMEVRAATAWVQQDKVEIWCGSQDPFFVKSRVAKLLGSDLNDVIVHSLRVGGGFGGRVLCQPAEEAALLSRLVGKPVKVEWSREDEFQNNYFQPPYSHSIEAGVTANGSIAYWQHDFASAPIITGPIPNSIAWVVDSFKADEGTARGSLHPYGIVNQRIRYSDIRTEVPIGAWRGLGSAPNCFAIESMMDELAYEAGIDPLDFRLYNLSPNHERLKNTLITLEKMKSGLQERSQQSVNSIERDYGYGIACAVYKNQTPVAVAVQVDIDHSEGNIFIRKINCVQDCGAIINPQQVKNQIMGNLVWGCSMAIKERVTFDEGHVVENNFDGYQILRHDECPEINIELVKSDKPATGAGEAALGPVAAAIANAVFNATSVRIRDLPITYDDLF